MAEKSVLGEFMQKELELERLLDFTEVEQKQIVQVKAKLKETNEEFMWDTLTLEQQRMLMRGLRHRKHCVRDVSDLTKQIYEFRKKNDMDKSLNKLWTNHEVFWSGWPSYVAGQDIYGHWVNYESVGEMQVKTLDLIDQDECVLMRCQYYEAQCEMKRRICRNQGFRTNKFVYILDLKELQFTKHFTPKVKNVLQPLLQVCGDMYPDILWSMYIINSPYTFSMIWRVISPWVDKDVKPKIHILGGPGKYLPRMKKFGIPEESIPEKIGGKAKLVNMRDIIENIVDNPESNETFLTYVPPELPSGNTEDILSDDADKVAARQAAIQQGENEAKAAAEAEEEDEFDEGEVLMEGWLAKRGKINKDYKRRYFVLTPHNLTYFTGDPRERDSDIKGKIELFMVSSCKPGPVQTGEQIGEFEIITPFRTYNLQVEGRRAAKREALKDWVSSIADAAAEEASSLDIVGNSVHHIRSGYMKKRGVFNTLFKRRYFVLTESALYYFNGDPSDPQKSLKGKIRLTKITKIEGSKKGLDIHTKYRVFHIKAKDEADQVAWVQSLRESADKAKEKAQNSKRVSEIEDEVRNIPYLDKVAVMEAEKSFGGTGNFMENITGVVRRAVQVAAGLNMITNQETGEKLRGDEVGVNEIMNMATDRMKNMIGYVFELTTGSDE